MSITSEIYMKIMINSFYGSYGLDDSYSKNFSNYLNRIKRINNIKKILNL